MRSTVVVIIAQKKKEKNKRQDRCHQWSTRPDPQSRQQRTLFSHCFVLLNFEKWRRTDVSTNGRHVRKQRSLPAERIKIEFLRITKGQRIRRSHTMKWCSMMVAHKYNQLITSDLLIMTGCMINIKSYICHILCKNDGFNNSIAHLSNKIIR